MKIATDRASLKRRGLTCDFRESGAFVVPLIGRCYDSLGPSLYAPARDDYTFSRLFQTSTMFVFTPSCNGAAGPKLGV